MALNYSYRLCLSCFLKAGQLSAPMHQLIRKISILLYFSYIVSRIYYAPPACVWVSHPLSTCGQSVHHFHPRWHNVNSGTPLQSNHSEDFSSGPTRPTVSTSSLGYFAKPVRHLDKFSDLSFYLQEVMFLLRFVCLFDCQQKNSIRTKHIVLKLLPSAFWLFQGDSFGGSQFIGYLTRKS